MAPGLQSLPVELLYELQLFALSESLPLVSHRFYDVFKHASPFFNARYILGHALRDSTELFMEDVYAKALRYPICNQNVLQALGNSMKRIPSNGAPVQLPRRIFGSLKPPESGWGEVDYPLPLLRYLYEDPNIPRINVNSHGGYGLTRAVHARFVPLVQFLLDHHASPKCRNNLAVEVAIRQKNLEMVKLLVERPQSIERNGKRRKTEDRVLLNSKMLKYAFMAGASDIVRYLYREKKVLPDVQTLKKMT